MTNLGTLLYVYQTLLSADLLKCILHVTSVEFSGSVLLLHSDRDTEAADAAGALAHRLSMTYFKVMMFTTNGKPVEQAFVKPTRSIIWITDFENFRDQVLNVIDYQIWQSTAKLLVVFVNRTGTSAKTEHEQCEAQEKKCTDEEKEFRRQKKVNLLLSVLWQHAKVANILVLTENKTFYTWFPYQKYTCNQNISSVKIGTCGSYVQYFPPKIPRTLHHCSIYAIASRVYPYVGTDDVTGLPYDGIEINIIKAFAKKYDGVLEYVNLPEGEIFYSGIGPLQGAPKLLKAHKVDFALGGFFLSYRHYTYSDPLNPPHSSDEVIWFIPQPEPLPSYQNLYLAFEIDCWILLFVTGMLITISLSAASYLNDGKHPEISLQSLRALSVTLNLSVSMPKSFLLKSLLIIFFVYGIHIATAYQSSLISFLTKPVMEAPISCVKEGLEKGLIPFMYEPLKPYILQEGFPNQKEILKKDRHVFRQEMMFQSMTTFKDKMILGIKSTTLFYLARLGIVNDKNQLLVRTLHPGVLSCHVTIIISKWNPLKKILDATVREILESGLSEKWAKDLIRSNEKVVAPIHSDGLSSLTTKNLAGAFYILIVGIISSVFSITVEIFFKDAFRKNQRK